MKKVLTFLLLILTLIFLINFEGYSQDSTKIKEYENDKVQLELNFQKAQQTFNDLTAEANRLEGALSYIQTFDSSMQKVKDDSKLLVESYSKTKTKLVEIQIQLYILKGYLEYNSILLQREQEKLKK